MKATMKLAALVAAMSWITLDVAYAVPLVSGVTMNQRPNSRMVDIGYELSGAAAIVTLGIETNGVPLPDSAVTWLYNDVCKVVQTGTHSIVWNAGEDWPGYAVTNAKARVTVWQTNSPPQVMVIDLIKGTSATPQDPYPVYYYTSAAAVPRGVTNDLYKTDSLLMRRLSPTDGRGFTMGDESNPDACVNVTLTQAFYAGVYQVTQKQWQLVMGADPSQFKNTAGPVEGVSYHDIRENPSTNKPLDPNWPATNTVGESSFMGLLQSKTGLAGFDLPTDAQWEYACRAGTKTYYNATNELNDLGWYSGNAEGTTHTVGQKTPNDWGLYDMHGNVWEWCLDWCAGTLSGGDDPVGADSGSSRVIRGGYWLNPASHCRSATRYDYAPSSRNRNIGFRLVRTLP